MKTSVGDENDVVRYEGIVDSEGISDDLYGGKEAKSDVEGGDGDGITLRLRLLSELNLVGETHGLALGVLLVLLGVAVPSPA